MSGNALTIKLLHEAKGHDVTVEMKSGELYTGKLVSAEDNMNVQLGGLVHIARTGKRTPMNAVFLRGSHIRLFLLPEMLKLSPMFKLPSGKTAATIKPFAQGGVG